jgi:hypothetical protein
MFEQTRHQFRASAVRGDVPGLLTELFVIADQYRSLPHSAIAKRRNYWKRFPQFLSCAEQTETIDIKSWILDKP